METDTMKIAEREAVAAELFYAHRRPAGLDPADADTEERRRQRLFVNQDEGTRESWLAAADAALSLIGVHRDNAHALSRKLVHISELLTHPVGGFRDGIDSLPGAIADLLSEYRSYKRRYEDVDKVINTTALDLEGWGGGSAAEWVQSLVMQHRALIGGQIPDLSGEQRGRASVLARLLRRSHIDSGGDWSHAAFTAMRAMRAAELPPIPEPMEADVTELQAGPIVDDGGLTLPARLIEAAAERGGISLTIAIGEPQRDRLDRVEQAINVEWQGVLDGLIDQNTEVMGRHNRLAEDVARLRDGFNPCGHTPPGWSSHCTLERRQGLSCSNEGCPFQAEPAVAG